MGIVLPSVAVALGVGSITGIKADTDEFCRVEELGQFYVEIDLLAEGIQKTVQCWLKKDIHLYGI